MSSGRFVRKEDKKQATEKHAYFWLTMLIVPLFTASVVAAQDATHNFMPGTEFSKFHTYKWVNIQGSVHSTQIVDAEIKQSVDSQLATKGLTGTDTEKMALYVGYQVLSIRKSSGMRVARAVASAGVLLWGLQRSRQSMLEPSFSICVTRPRSG